jgi:diacylglycerol kinase (ATP)
VQGNVAPESPRPAGSSQTWRSILPSAVTNVSLKKATLIYNPIAGRRPAKREREVRQASAVLRDAGVEVELASTTRPGMAEGLARSAVARGVDLVLVCGGDGTINEVINGLALSQIPLGILPGGTANILARELRLPQSPLRAARQLARWSPRRIALGRAWWSGAESRADGSNSSTDVLCRYYASVAGIGFDAHIVYKLSSQLKMGFGVAGYVMEALRQLVSYSFPTFSCRLDGHERRSTFAVVHRTRLYAGWLHMAPSADLFAPRFTVCSFSSRSRARYFLYALAVLGRQHLRLGDVALHQGAQVVCTPGDGSTTIRFELDGELVGTLPVRFEIVPDALTILVP